MKITGLTALALLALLGGDAWAKTESVSSRKEQDGVLQQQTADNKRLKYAQALLARDLSEEDRAICARKVPQGDGEQGKVCHVTRNYLVDIFNKADLVKPVQADPRYVVTKEEWDAMKARM